MNKIVGLMILQFVFSGCATSRSPNQRYVAMNESFRLTWSERQQCKRAARIGDADAAMRLSQYFTFYEMDGTKRDYWLLRAAQLGHPVAQYNLGVSALQKATDWFKLAADAGDEQAKDKLKMLGGQAEGK
jgi:TPR repeat protein